MGSELTDVTQEQDLELIRNDFMKAIVAKKMKVRELLGK